MKKDFAKFVALSVLLGMVSSRAVVEAIEFRRFGGESSKYTDSIIRASVDSKVLKKETKELKEKNRSLDERLTKLEKEVKKHKAKDYHGYGLRNGGWWKNILSNFQADLVYLPFRVLFYTVVTVFANEMYNVNNSSPNPNSGGACGI